WTPRRHGSRTGHGLIAFICPVQLHAVVADVSHLPHDVLRQRLLNAEVPLFDVWNGIEKRPASDLRRRSAIEAVLRRIGRRRPRRELSAQWNRARDIHLVADDGIAAETDERRVVGHTLADAKAFVLR